MSIFIQFSADKNLVSLYWILHCFFFYDSLLEGELIEFKKDKCRCEFLVEVKNKKKEAGEEAIKELCQKLVKKTKTFRIVESRP